MQEAEHAALARLRELLLPAGERAIVAAVVRPTPGVPLVLVAVADADVLHLRAAGKEFLRLADELERTQQVENKPKQWWQRD